MKPRHGSLLSLGFVVLAFVLTLALYARLPEVVPVHWNVHGVADGFAPKPWGPFLMPLVMAGTLLLLSAVPRLSPRNFPVAPFSSSYALMKVALIAFLFLTQVAMLLAGVGFPVSITRVLFAGLGLLFIVLGNVLGKATRNFFIGIRTPWTLASDEVWLRTHRLAGRLMVLAGLLLLVGGLLGVGLMGVLIAAIGAVAVVPVAYSYWISRRLEGGGSGEGHPRPPA